MKARKILLPIVLAIFAIGFFSVFVVKEINQAIVLQFGDPKRIITTPGFQVKIPFIQNVVFLDRRILSLDPPPEEVIASDQKRLIVDAFARFKIIDPLKFYISVGNERVARSRLATIINSRLRNVLGKQSLATLLSEDRTKQMAIIQEGVNNEAEKFGIEIIDVRIKRADLPQANSEAIYRRMQTEREREAKEFRAKGAEMAVTITSTADKEVTVILAEAKKNSGSLPKASANILFLWPSPSPFIISDCLSAFASITVTSLSAVDVIVTAISAPLALNSLASLSLSVCILL